MGKIRNRSDWNLAVLLTTAQVDMNIPKKLKELAWKRNVMPDGTIEYTQRTWREWGQSVNYANRFGTPLKFVDATWQGQDVGTRFAMKIRFELDEDSPNALARTKFRVVSKAQAIAFVAENS